MEWTSCLKQAIDYMEEHLLDLVTTEQLTKQIGKEIHMSSFYFQKCFQMVTGFSVGEYLRNRRLYEAACELVARNCKVIEVALKYGYDTPESFTKAFRRFHGVTPTMVKKYPKLMKQFLPLQVTVSVAGGNKIDYFFEKMDAFTFIGFEGIFSWPTSYEGIPEFCRKMEKKYFHNLWTGNPPSNEIEQAIMDHNIGEYGAVINTIGKRKFRYLLAGMYQGGYVPEGLVLYTFKASEWIKFSSRGPNPDTIQQLNTQIFRDWVPEHKEYEVDPCYNIEWYDDKDSKAEDHESQIWIPARRKKQ